MVSLRSLFLLAANWPGTPLGCLYVIPLREAAVLLQACATGERLEGWRHDPDGQEPRLEAEAQNELTKHYALMGAARVLLFERMARKDLVITFIESERERPEVVVVGITSIFNFSSHRSAILWNDEPYLGNGEGATGHLYRNLGLTIDDFLRRPFVLGEKLGGLFHGLDFHSITLDVVYLVDRNTARSCFRLLFRVRPQLTASPYQGGHEQRSDSNCDCLHCSSSLQLVFCPT